MKKNIVVVGYPKSGSTWVTRLTGQLLNCPVKGYWGMGESGHASEGRERSSDYQCYQSHHLFHELYSDSKEEIFKIVYVTRDPRDIVVSGSFHFNFYLSFLHRLFSRRFLENTILGKYVKRLSLPLLSYRSKKRRMITALKCGDPNIKHMNIKWDEHLLSYFDKDTLMIKYEEVIADPVRITNEILAHIGFQKSESEIKVDIQSQSFLNKKSEFRIRGERDKEKHLRAGKAGQWRHYLNKKEADEISNHFSALMIRLGYLP